MKYIVNAKIIVKSYPKSGKAIIDGRNILIDEVILADTIRDLFTECNEKEWERMELEVHKA